MRVFLCVAVIAVLVGSIQAAQTQLLISGNDEKVTWDDEGKLVPHPPGKDTVSIIDIGNRTKPRIVANLPIINSVVGPPTMWRSRPIRPSPWSPIRSTGS